MRQLVQDLTLLTFIMIVYMLYQVIAKHKILIYRSSAILKIPIYRSLKHGISHVYRSFVLESRSNVKN